MADKVPPLPLVLLRDRKVPFEVLSVIPLATVEKYQVAAYAQEDQVLRLAVVHPEALKQGFYIALEDLGKKIGRKIELARTDAASMQSLIRQYKEGASPQPASEKSTQPPQTQPAKSVVPPVKVAPVPEQRAPRVQDIPKPPLFELGRTVSSAYLRKMPLTFSVQNHLACVDFLPPSTFWFISDAAHRQSAWKALRFIEEKNGITTHLLEAGEKDVLDLLEYYQSLAKSDLERQKSVPKGEKPMAFPAAGPVGKDVITPDIQATILTAVAAKPGLAGLMQKVAQNFSGEKEVPATAVVQPPVPEPEKNATTSEPYPAAPANPAMAVTPLTPKAASPTASEEESELGKLLSQQVDTLEELKVHIKNGFIPRIVAAVVSYAIHEKASDIHIEAFEDEVRIRYRVDGQLVDIIKLPPDVHAAMVSRIKILSRLRLDETRVPQDGRFDVNFKDMKVDLRISVMPTVHGEKVVMRILDKSKGVASLEELGIEGLAYQNLTTAIKKPYGICLATGPTGSGKSTSLYAILNRIATPNVNVVTLEDPVEYEVKGINQSQIRPKIGYTFAEGLRSILRQDPNIIMVGEIRDGETATMATQSALTGHLVLSTLHTNDASGAIPRLTNMGIEPFLIASSMNIAMGQRLVRKICQNCKQVTPMPQGILDKVKADLAKIAKASPLDAKRIKEPYQFFQGKGCAVCGGKGYLGRMGIYEVLTMTDAIEDLTLKRASASTIQEQAEKEGMLTMYQDGLLKVISGVTTLDEVLRETSNK